MKYLFTIQMDIEVEAETAQQAYKISQNIKIGKKNIELIDWDTKRIWDDKGNDCSVNFEDNEMDITPKRSKPQIYVEDIIKEEYNGFDIFWDKNPGKENEIVEDDGSLHRNFGYIRLCYYFGQDKAITKENKKRFEKESQKEFNNLFHDITTRGL